MTNIYQNPQAWLEEFESLAMSSHPESRNSQDGSVSARPTDVADNDVFVALARAMMFVTGSERNPHNQTLKSELNLIILNN